MKNHKNRILCLSSIFMTPQSWKITKIRRSVFHQFSGPRGHENSNKSGANRQTSFLVNLHNRPGYMNFQKNIKLQFCPISIDPGTWIFKKMSNLIFGQSPQTRIHEYSKKCQTSILANFHRPGYMNFQKNIKFQFWPISMKFQNNISNIHSRVQEYSKERLKLNFLWNNCATGNLKWPCTTENLRWPCATKIWEKLKPMNKNDFEIYSPNFISLAWKAKKLGKTCTLRLPVRPLCAHCGLSFVPFCAVCSLCAPFCATLWETHCFDSCFT